MLRTKTPAHALNVRTNPLQAGEHRFYRAPNDLGHYGYTLRCRCIWGRDHSAGHLPVMKDRAQAWAEIRAQFEEN